MTAGEADHRDDAGVLSDLAAWQAVLDRHGELFEELTPGSRIGLVTKAASAMVAGRASTVRTSAFDPSASGVLVWEASATGMRAEYRTCHTMADAAVDLLLVADDEALAQVGTNLDGEPLRVMRALIRRGHILFYVTRTKRELREAGYEDFLDSLGLAFLGACR